MWIVPALRFPEFTEEWMIQTINDLATVIGGGTPDTTIKSYWDGNIQWFTPSEIGKSKYRKNITVKGGVVMHNISKDMRRATRDMDIDFIKYSLEDKSIRNFPGYC